MWPSLAPVFGSDSFHKGNEGRRWAHFYATGCPYATELQSEWERLKDLYMDALNTAQDTTTAPTPDPLFNDTPEGFGAQVPTKLHKKVFDTISRALADAMDRRARLLAFDDQRRMARLASSKDKFANSLLAGTPVAQAKFTSLEFETAVQCKFGVPVRAIANLVGRSITNHANCSPTWVDPYGNNLKKVIGVKNDGVRALHDTIVDTMSTTLELAKIQHKGGVRGNPSSCSDVFSDLLSWDEMQVAEQRRMQGIIPDLIVNGTSVRPAGETTSNPLHGVTTLLDNKTLCNLKDYEGPNPEQAANKREAKVNPGYVASSRGLDNRFHGTQDGEAGPVEKRLLQFGRRGKVHATVFGTFGDASQGVTDLCDLAADALAHEHLRFYDGTPSQAKAMNAFNIRRVWGHTAQRGWAKLILDRRCFAGGDPSWSAPPTTTQEDPDESAALFDFHFANPGAGVCSGA